MDENTRQVRRYMRFVNSITGDGTYNRKDKDRNAKNHIAYMLNRTNRMFKWRGLPDTIPEYLLEIMLQTNGNVCFYKTDGELYAFTGGLGGTPDPYYRPTIYTIANPALKLFVNADIDKDCVVMQNDSLYLGLLPMFERYAYSMAENELSMQVAIINSRIFSMISAPDDRTKESAERFIERIEEGELSVISENTFLDGIKAQPYASNGNTNILTNLIETEQYYKASWFNELGLNANYNMKRESLNSAESQLNNDALLPLVDDMLERRKEGAEKVNNMFGTEISVSLASSWEDNQKEIDMEQNEISGQPENESQTETNPQKEGENIE